MSIHGYMIIDVHPFTDFKPSTLHQVSHRHVTIDYRRSHTKVCRSFPLICAKNLQGIQRSDPAIIWWIWTFRMWRHWMGMAWKPVIKLELECIQHITGIWDGECDCITTYCPLDVPNIPSVFSWVDWCTAVFPTMLDVAPRPCTESPDVVSQRRVPS